MRDVAQHIDEYGRDGDNRRHCNPITGQRVGRRSLHVMSLRDLPFNWLGAPLISTAGKASDALLSAIHTTRDDTPDESAKTTD